MSGEEGAEGVGQQGGYKVILQPPRLTMTGGGSQDAENVATAVTESVERAKMQAATCLDIRKDISSVDRFCGETGELNHFIRSGDSIISRIGQKLFVGRLDPTDAESLRRALTRRVHRNVLNRLQADEGTSWVDLRSSLQKEYGSGRWSPEEDAVRMLQLKRGSRQSKGDYAAQLSAAYNGVVNKLVETVDKAALEKITWVLERLATVHLKAETGATSDLTITDLANQLIDAEGRGQEGHPPEREYEPHWNRNRRRMPDMRPVQRERRRDAYQAAEPRRMAEGRTRRPDPRGDRKGAGQRCYACGKSGHVQARCSEVRCFECNTRGHMARACPYIKRRQGPRDEPMEVNCGQNGYKGRKRVVPKPQETGSDESDQDGTQTSDGQTDEEEEPRNYASVCSGRRRKEEKRGRRA